MPGAPTRRRRFVGGRARRAARPRVSAEVVRRSGLVDDLVVAPEDADDLLLDLAFRGDLVPEGLGRVLDLGPFGGGNGAQRQLVALGAQPRLAAPVPLVAVGVACLGRRHDQLLKVVGQVGPLPLVHEPRPDPRARDVVGQEVVGDVRPADGVVLGDARPGHAVQLARLHGDFCVGVGDVDRDDANCARKRPAVGKV